MLTLYKNVATRSADVTSKVRAHKMAESGSGVQQPSTTCDPLNLSDAAVCLRSREISPAFELSGSSLQETKTPFRLSVCDLRTATHAIASTVAVRDTTQSLPVCHGSLAAVETSQGSSSVGLPPSAPLRYQAVLRDPVSPRSSCRLMDCHDEVCTFSDTAPSTAIPLPCRKQSHARVGGTGLVKARSHASL